MAFRWYKESNTPRPAWVSRPDYSLPQAYFGVGEASRDGRSRDEQTRRSEDDAKSHLVQQIEVTIKAENSTLGYISPMKFEKNWFVAQLKDAA